VPSTVIQDGAVWLVADGKLRRQPVRTGVAGAGHTEIVEGLTPEARIVETPSDQLREGRAARIRPPLHAGAP